VIQEYLCLSYHRVSTIFDLTMETQNDDSNNILYKSILQIAMDSFWLVNMHGQIIEVNEKYCQMSGYSEKELLAMSISDLESTETKNETFTHIDKVAENSSDRFESIHHRKDGSKYDVEISVQYKAVGNGWFVVFLRDITHRKQTENELARQKLFVEAVTETSPAIIYVFDLETNRNVFTNSGIERMLGYSKIEIHEMGENVLANIIHPNDMQDVFDLHKKFISAKDEDMLTIEYRIKHRNGKWVHLQSTERIFLRNADGSVKQKIGIAIDTSEQKTAQEEIKTLNKQLLTTIESMTDAFVSLDTEWRYTYMSKNAGLIFNCEPQSMIGKHIWTEFPESVGQSFYLACHKAMKEQKPQFLTEYYAPFNKWFENRIFPSPTGLSIFFADITERKQNETEILRHTNELKMLELLSREISGTLSLDEIIPTAVKSLMATVKPDMVIFFIRENNKLVLKDMAPKSAIARLDDFPDHKVGECLCGLAVLQNKSIYSKDINTDSRCTWQECKLQDFAHLPLFR